MKHFVPALAAAAVLLSTGAFAQSSGEADYNEQCKRTPMAGSAAEQAATRQRCIEEAKKAAKTDVPGAANQPGTSATAGRATKAERDAASAKRRAEGKQAARASKQDPKNPVAP